MSALNIVRNAVIKKAVVACISAYTDIVASSQSQIGTLLLEDQRRNQLVHTIKTNKEKYKFDYIITTESGEYNLEDYKTTGRIDICISYNLKKYKQEYVSFECKRFIKNNSSESEIDKAYYIDGINRYETCKYLCDTGIGGMIAFCEDGNYDKLKNSIVNVLQNHSSGAFEDESALYNHNYVHSCLIQNINGQKIKIISIMMDFAKR